MSKEVAQAWLQASHDDLILIQEILHNEQLTHLVAFHAQQSIEKSLKGLLELENRDVPKKHDLLLLKNLVLPWIGKMDEEILEELNELYIESRYPGDFGLLPSGKPTVQEAEHFYHYAKSVYDQIKNEINGIS